MFGGNGDGMRYNDIYIIELTKDTVVSIIKSFGIIYSWYYYSTMCVCLCVCTTHKIMYHSI